MNCPHCGHPNPAGETRCAKCDRPLKPGESKPSTSFSGWSSPAASDDATSFFAASSTIQTGTLLGGRYEIIQLLGEGGMGAVYKAKDRAVDRFVALKVIRSELATRPEILQRFKQELILARQITHKNVIRIFDLGEADGVKFISMEFVEGKDLKSMVREKGKLDPEEAKNIVIQVCRALNAAHSEGVIHRDLKPQNIMVDSQGSVKVMDFGIARSMETPGLTTTGMVIGTPEYMSPEQGKAQHLDGRSDLYSLGVIFYELVTGQTPHHADTALAIMLRREREIPRPPREISAEIPESLNRVVMRSLEMAPAQRYQSALEVLQDLESRTGVRSGTTGRAPWTIGLSLRMPRFRLVGRIIPWGIVPAAVGTVVVALAVTGFLLRHKLFPPHAANAAHAPVSVLVADFSNYTGDPIFVDTLEPMVNVALEGASFINAYNRGTARKLAEKLPHPTEKLDEQSARLVAVGQGINAVITGEISQRGNGYSVSATALDAVTGNVLARSEITAENKDQVLLDIPKLAAPIRQALGDTTPESVQIEKAGGAFTAANLEAVHEYGVAMEQQFAGNVQGAFQGFSKAAELDPGFARAYAGMAGISRNLGKLQDTEKYIKLAMEHVDRMTERERYRVRGGYYGVMGDWQKCVEEYGELVKLYPADNIGQLNLAVCYADLRNMPKAVEAAQQAVEIVPKGALQRLNLSFFSSYAGDFQSGEKEARTALELNPTSEVSHLALAEAQMGQGQLDQAAETYHKMEKISPLGASMAASGLADIASYEGRYTEAARILEQGAAADLGAKNSDNAATKLVALAHIHLLRGQTQAAVAAAEKALADSQSVPVRFLAALVFVRTGDPTKAQKLAASLRSEIQAEPQSYASIIEGMAAEKRGDNQQAIAALSGANKVFDSWISRFELGRVYLDTGHFVEADSEFDRCMQRRGEALELFMDSVPTYGYLPGVYYYEGRVLEGLKSPGFAKPYETYLSIRGEAGEDPLLADVRRRVGK